MRVQVPDEKISTLGSEAAIKKHFTDAQHLKALFTMAAQARELAGRWPKLPAVEKTAFLTQRASVIGFGFRMLNKPDDQWSPLLAEALAAARTEWQQAVPMLSALSAA